MPPQKRSPRELNLRCRKPLAMEEKPSTPSIREYARVTLLRVQPCSWDRAVLKTLHIYMAPVMLAARAAPIRTTLRLRALWRAGRFDMLVLLALGVCISTAVLVAVSDCMRGESMAKRPLQKQKDGMHGLYHTSHQRSWASHSLE